MTEAHELSQHLVEGWTEINAKRRDYLEEGRVPESERDQIEADMLMFVKVRTLLPLDYGSVACFCTWMHRRISQRATVSVTLA